MNCCPTVKKPELELGSQTRGRGEEDLTAQPLRGQAVSVNKHIKTLGPGFGDMCVQVWKQTGGNAGVPEQELSLGWSLGEGRGATGHSRVKSQLCVKGPTASNTKHTKKKADRKHISMLITSHRSQGSRVSVLVVFVLWLFASLFI